ncbi:helix-turn-helix transcriptional regulator [Streptomyces sp. CBMA29]|uniref:helix-turn-helix transcriptional regulator n=1 Tax=Streptomyces sp. CBMA29 TaxID=1896314 RepID=UPI001661D507|nr:helix-turn-helix domain-containing protein [Streptomyces sp. CBMA29]MBD0736190.1 excisionase [Streptomyces sp. CBMA29]
MRLASRGPTRQTSGRRSLKLPEVLDEIGMSRSAFYRMRARGKAPRCIKLPNGQIRVRRSDLDTWLSSCEQGVD